MGEGSPDASQPGLEKAGETMKETLSSPLPSPTEQKGSLRWTQKAALEKIWCDSYVVDQFSL